MALFDILNVNPAQNVQPYSVDPTLSQQGLLGMFAQLGQVGARGIAQAAGRDLRSPQARINQASSGINFDDPEQLRVLAQRLNATGESARAAAIIQLAKEEENKRAAELAGRDRFVVAGSNVFDMVQNKWITPPDQEDVDKLSPAQIAELYKNFTPESISQFISDVNSPLERIDPASLASGMSSNQIAELYKNFTPESISQFMQDNTQALVPLDETSGGLNQIVGQLLATDNVIGKVDDALRLSDEIWGATYDLAKFLPMTNARSLRGLIDTIDSNLALDRLQKIKNESKTGGALGQVSNMELLLLRSAIESLDPAIGNENITRLRAVRDHYRNFRNALLGITPEGANYKVISDESGVNSIFYKDVDSGNWYEIGEL